MMNAPLDVFQCPLDGIHLIEASAGTGKTWTICGLYLRLLLERERTVREILVVTFTTAATAELRERIRARLVEMLEPSGAANGGDPFIAQLGARLDALGIDERRRGELLRAALETFDEASIFTIHGFCQRALADNPFAAGLPMQTELVENDQDLLMEAVNDFWRRHVASAAVSLEFAGYLHSRGDSPKKYAELLRRHLAKPLGGHRWPDDIDAPPVAVSLDAAYGHVCDLWQRQGEAVVDLLLGALSELNGNIYKESAVRQGAAEWARLCRLNSPRGEIGDKARLYRSTVLAAAQKKNRTAPRHAFFDAAEEYCALRARAEASLALARLRLLRSLFEEAGAQLRELKVARQVISFDDMLSNVHARLNDPAYPWLATAIRTRFPAALIDEFQDTDPLQFDIFRRIYPQGESQVFVVGDPKQAIYSFRHADLHTYLRAKSWAATEWPLADNQRSSAALVSALNGLFEINEQAFILPHLDYRHVEFGSKRRPEFVDTTQARAALQLWSLPQDAGKPMAKGAARTAAVQATCAEIARLIRAGGRGEITLDGQPLSPRHIAVLVRTRALGDEVKRALTDLGVGAVEMSRDSVFGGSEALDLERVLTAVLTPVRESLVRAALATDLIGCTVAEIEAVSGDEALLLRHILEFTDYRDLWQREGFGVMYRRLLAEQRVARRMLQRPDGERRLTNFLHLGELLHQAAETHDAPEALLRYLKRARDEEASTESTQLRLESDQNLVQIVTIHTCKGLEYPIVFCPFICEGISGARRQALEGMEYHDDRLQPVIDFRRFDARDPEKTRIEGIGKLEQSAEMVRLLYVALTRAVHRCYVVTGCYVSSRSLKESTRSMLNWLVAGSGMTFGQWLTAELDPEKIEAAWHAFAQAHPGAVAFEPLPVQPGVPLDATNTENITGPTAISPVRAGGWRLSSYSGLSFGAHAERAADDRDARVVSAPSSTPASGVDKADILRFPRGPSAGECIHAVFEEIDFGDQSTWEPAIAAALLTHPQTLPGVPAVEQRAQLVRMLRMLILDVTQTELRPGLRLQAVGRRQRLTELEFMLPAPHLSARELNTALRAMGYDMPSLRFGQLEGYLKGFIDLVFEHQGRYFLVDWKSNHLGNAAADYAQEPVASAMAEHGYHLQYLLYTVALDRYLRLCRSDYRYETHFGGVLYLFVRGVRPAWSGSDGTPRGIYFHRPTLEAVQRLNELLDHRTAAEAT